MMKQELLFHNFAHLSLQFYLINKNNRFYFSFTSLHTLLYFQYRMLLEWKKFLLVWMIVALALAKSKPKKSKSTKLSKVSSKNTPVDGQFVRIYDNALPTGVVNRLVKESETVAAWSLQQKSFLHGKKPTFWLDLRSDGVIPPPRNYIELAIMLLKRYMTTNNTIAVNKDDIVGAEWWVQQTGSTEGIGFHYDKDESMASTMSVLKCPSFGTVTYLSNVGGPTVLLNMTTPDGNRDIPAIPELGFVSYPKFNRHLVFK